MNKKTQKKGPHIHHGQTQYTLLWNIDPIRSKDSKTFIADRERESDLLEIDE